MKLPYDDDKNDGISPLVLATMLISALFLIILIGVYYFNRSDHGNKKETQVQQSKEPEESAAVYVQSEDHALTPDDLDFWDMYPESTPIVYVEETPKPIETEAPSDPATDGKHTKVVNLDGEEEWLLINPALVKNSYNATSFMNKSGKMQYMQDGRSISYFGVDLSKNQNYVDFTKLKKAGADFVMLRLGARGYESGLLVLDECFQDNMKRASDAGLDVGVYFFSQAINQDEIAEEAQFVLDHLEGYNITYPVAFDMEYVPNDTCRVEGISKKTKTELAIAFADIMEISGYHTLIYGDKEWLLKEIDLSKLSDRDIWLSQIEDLPDYPYRFAMWQYNKNGTIDGVEGTVSFDISFIDYAEK